jgi:DNA-binding MarR family transcriptional regulator
MQEPLKAPLQECAREVLDVVPLVMREIRKQLRKHSARVLSVPQFRTLLFVNRHKGASLSDVAEHIGLTLPSMSTLIDGLVTRNFVVRRTHQDDRRRMTLTLTERGETTLRSAREGTHAYLTRRLSRFSETQRGTVVKGMRILKQVFLEEVA